MQPSAQVEQPSPTVTANLPSMVRLLGDSDGRPPSSASASVVNRIKCCSVNSVCGLCGQHRQLSPQLRLISSPILLLLLLSLVLSPLVFTSAVAYGSAGSHSRKLFLLFFSSVNLANLEVSQLAPSTLTVQWNCCTDSLPTMELICQQKSSVASVFLRRIKLRCRKKKKL